MIPSPPWAAHRRGRTLLFGLAALGLVLVSTDALAARPAGSLRMKIASSTLVINEVEYIEPNVPGIGQNDLGEFVEIHNKSDQAINLGDYVLVGINSRGGQYRRFALPAIDLQAQAFFVVCGHADRVPNCDVVVSPDTNIWEDQRDQGPAAIGLVKNDGALPANDELVDSVSYNGNTPGGPQKGGTWTEGAGVLPGDPGIDANRGIARVPDGQDTDQNAEDFHVRCVTPGGPNPAGPPNVDGCFQAARQPSLVINELDVTQPVTDDMEFVEIKNVSSLAQSLGHKALVAVSSQGIIYHHDLLPAVVLAPGEHFLVCTNTGKLAGCDYALPGSGDNYWFDPGTRASTINALAIMKSPTGKQDGDILIDTVSYGGDVAGQAPNGGSWVEEAGKVSIDPGTAAYQGLSRSPDGQDNDDNSSDFEVKCTTPGYANAAGGPPTGCGPPATRTPRPTVTHTPSSTPTDAPTRTVAPTDMPTDEPTKTPVPTDTPAGPTATSEPARLIFVVNDIGNDEDASVGDGFCRTRRERCTLRAALQELNGGAKEPAFELRFGGPGTIEVPAGDPLPALKRSNGLINGASARPSLASRFNLSMGLDAPDQVLPLVGISGPPGGLDAPALVLDGVSGVTVQGLNIQGFSYGLVLRGEAHDNFIGTHNDGAAANLERNVIHDNSHDGVAIDLSAHDNILRGNVIFRNKRGIGLMRTATGGNTLSRNSITANGGAAIGVARGGGQLAPPVIDQFLPSSRTLRGHVVGNCARCQVEVFADTSDEAMVYLDTVDVAAGTGQWSASNLNVPADAPGLTASLTDGLGNTSRLSDPNAAGARWRLVEVPPDHPHALGQGRTLLRKYRLLDEGGNPQINAKVVWSPIDKTFITDENGLATCLIPLDELAAQAALGTAMSIQAVSRDGSAHPVLWHPRMAVAMARRPQKPGDLILDLSDLDDDGIGGTLSSPKTLLDVVASLDEIVRILGLQGFGGTARTHVMGSATHGMDRETRLAGPAQGESQSFGAAFTAAENVQLREGEFSWQENLARGGGIYEVRAVGETLSGNLEIVAPSAAFSPGQAASACSASPLGATIAGWNDFGKCWVPVPGSTLSAPGTGDSTFSASANVSIPATTGFAGLALNAGRGRVLLGHLQATSTYTLFTVGYDNQSPLITLTVSSGTQLAQLPPVLAKVDEQLSGIDGSKGITATLGGKKLVVAYDQGSQEIQVPPGDRALPAGVSGTVMLVLEVRDGFCNRTTKSVSVQIASSVATPTPTPPPGGNGRTIYAPFTVKGVSFRGR